MPGISESSMPAHALRQAASRWMIRAASSGARSAPTSISSATTTATRKSGNSLMIPVISICMGRRLARDGKKSKAGSVISLPCPDLAAEGPVDEGDIAEDHRQEDENADQREDLALRRRRSVPDGKGWRHQIGVGRDG